MELQNANYYYGMVRVTQLKKLSKSKGKIMFTAD